MSALSFARAIGARIGGRGARTASVPVRFSSARFFGSAGKGKATTSESTSSSSGSGTKNAAAGESSSSAATGARSAVDATKGHWPNWFKPTPGFKPPPGHGTPQKAVAVFAAWLGSYLTWLTFFKVSGVNDKIEGVVERQRESVAAEKAKAAGGGR